MSKRFLLLALLFVLVLKLQAQIVGATFSNPIDLGILNVGNFNNTKYNSPSNGFGNDYTGVNNQVSDDIFYKFEITSTQMVEIYHTGSILDSYVHLIQNDGSWLASNDNYNSLSAGIKMILPAGTYYIVSEGKDGFYGYITTNVAITTTTEKDLFVNSSSFTYNFNQYNNINLTINYKWYGLTAGTQFKTSIYLSSDQTYSTNDILLREKTESIYYGGYAIFSSSLILNIPSSVAFKKWYIIIKDDVNNQLIETNETNNAYSLLFNYCPQGSKKENAIDLGTTTQMVTYNQVQSTTYGNCFGNYYTGTDNQVSDDVFYKFTIPYDTHIYVNLSRSNFDTYVHLINEDGFLIASNDDFNGLTSFLNLNINAGTYYIIAEGFSYANGTIDMDVLFTPVFTPRPIDGEFAINPTGNNCQLNETIDESTNLINDAEVEINMYPNPSSEFVKFENLNQNYSTIQIIDLTGKIVYSEDVDLQDNTEINVQDFKNGMYIICLKKEDKIEIKKLQILH